MPPKAPSKHPKAKDVQNPTTASISTTSASPGLLTQLLDSIPRECSSVFRRTTNAQRVGAITQGLTGYFVFRSGTLAPVPLQALTLAAASKLLPYITHVPRWAVYTIFALILLVIVICILCICVKCCCKSRKRKKKKKIDRKISLMDVNGSHTAEGVQRDVGSSEQDSSNEPRGTLLYSLEYDAQRKELTVGVKEAAQLKAMDMGGTSDPYVKVYNIPNNTKTYETKVLRKTLNPVFDEHFKFQISQAELSQSTLVLQVFDFNRFSKHDIIGELRLQLGAVDWNHVIEEWQDLGEASKFEENLGEICFSLRYVPSTNKLTVVILEAKNLKKMDQGGSSGGAPSLPCLALQRRLALHPYVKVQLILGKRKWKKKKTLVKKRTLNPYFNETFTFEIPFDQIQRVQMVVSVWDHDKVSRNDSMGKVVLGCEATGNQLRHWADMLSNPRRPIAQWHTLLSAEQVDATLALKHGRRIPFTNKTFWHP
ncbi:hypothetical protein JZ751_008134 [Albula glossodonta]|uniref:C2 domain-containing protein n=1 Tax=Albula glossodonta TaxID=121402 RepID=A0A8T2N1U1_9TELE|nr:hypothetical protein JZ751_008134 [Albula glossodonta]